MSGLFGMFERRSIENPGVPLTSSTLLDWMGGSSVDSGVSVTERSAIKMSAVYRCVSLISSVSAALPLHVYKAGTKDRASARLLDNPHPDMTAYELWRLSYVHRCLWGNSYMQKVRGGGSGQVTELRPISPDRVRVGRVEPSDINPAGKMFEVTTDHGDTVPMTTREIFHLPGLSYDGLMGQSLVRVAAQGIGLSLAAESYAAKLFGSGNLLSGILKTEQRLEQAQAETLQSRWQQMTQGLERAHRTAVLDSGAAFQSLTMPSKDAQMLESRHFQITDAARFWGVPPFLMMETEKSTSWGTGLEQQSQGWITFDLHPQWLAPTEQRVTRELTVGGVYAKYRVEGLLRGDSTARAAFYTSMRNIGAYSANDIRAHEDMPPISSEAGGDQYLVPLAMGDLATLSERNKAGDPAAIPPNDAPPDPGPVEQ